MTVSVLITSYNHAPTLRRAIDSVLEQSVPCEIVVIDDGSTDGSVEIIRDYYDRGWLSCIHCGEHYGLMVATREGLRRCTGDYVALCDADDYYTDPLKLERQVEYMEANPDCGLCYTGAVYMDENGATVARPPVMEQVTYDTLLRGQTITEGTIMLRNRWFDIDQYRYHGITIPNYPVCIDTARVSKVGRIDADMYAYTVSLQSDSHTRSRLVRLRQVWERLRIRVYFIVRYGCRWSTAGYVAYQFIRDIMSVCLKRWYK